jgi:hypothetical protein
MFIQIQYPGADGREVDDNWQHSGKTAENLRRAPGVASASGKHIAKRYPSAKLIAVQANKKNCVLRRQNTIHVMTTLPLSPPSYGTMQLSLLLYSFHVTDMLYLLLFNALSKFDHIG